MENKTIEERKKECATKYYEEYHDSAIAVGIEKGYEIGATEQEAITKKEMIEKACEWFEKQFDYDGSEHNIHVFYRDAIESLRKALEQ